MGAGGLQPAAATTLGVGRTRMIVTPRPITIASRAAALGRPLALAATTVASLVLVVSLGTVAANLIADGAAQRESGGRELGQVFPDASRGPAETPAPEVTRSPEPESTPAATQAPAPPTPTPPVVTPVPVVPTPPPAPPAPEPVAYVVQKGDTLIGIAARFGTTADALMAFNGLESDVILIDQVLLIP